MKKTVLTYGLISGLIVTGLMYFTLSLERDKMFELGEKLGYLTMVIALSLIFFGIKSYRDKYNNGTITFGKGFLIGLYITLVAGLIYAAGWEIYYRQTGGVFMEQYMEYYQQKMIEEGRNEAEINEQVARMNSMAEYYKNPFIRFGFTLMELLPVGLLISLIAAALLRKKTLQDNTVHTN